MAKYLHLEIFLVSLGLLPVELYLLMQGYYPFLVYTIVNFDLLLGTHYHPTKDDLATSRRHRSQIDPYR